MTAEREKELLALLDRLEGRLDQGTAVVDLSVVIDATRAVIADNGALRRQVGSLRSVLITLVPDIQSVWNAARDRVLSVYSMVAPYLDPDAPMGTEWDEKVQAGYETDPEPPKPKDGDRGTCAVCGGEVYYNDPDMCAMGGWYHQERIPGHAAVFGGPA